MDSGPDSVACICLGDLGAVMPHHDPTEFPKAHPVCEQAMSCQASRLGGEVDAAITRAEQAEAELAEWKDRAVLEARRNLENGEKRQTAEAELATVKDQLTSTMQGIESRDRYIKELEAELERLRAGIQEAMQSRNELAMFNALKALLEKPDA